MIHDGARAVCSAPSLVYESMLCMLVPARECQSNPRLGSSSSTIIVPLPIYSRMAFVFLQGCDALVSPGSSFYHFASSLGGLTGPTTGMAQNCGKLRKRLSMPNKRSSKALVCDTVATDVGALMIPAS